MLTSSYLELMMIWSIYKSTIGQSIFSITLHGIVALLGAKKRYAVRLLTFSTLCFSVILHFLNNNLTISKSYNSREMVFFSITKSQHFYLICYDIRNQGHFIIDNIKREGSPKQYYNRVPDILHSHFCNYITTKNNLPLSRRIRRFKRTYLNMPWQTTYNSTDCGIFVRGNCISHPLSIVQKR
ncbi:hypothetical protein DCAR_0832693 [Daucus carota subsp. sativus]|uniref:Ubiquitin-like protease family profile domain-containing protein n=1 Tax=Daucus carota subsp. sativus TaxID=79200 RepID=A0AAF0XU48_DAUCS|nr:hypothetical protein DCAR_0832693 [Daucus carota subsp. sativus]